MKPWPWGEEPYEEAFTGTLTNTECNRIREACMGDCYQLIEAGNKTLIRATPTAMKAIVEIVEEVSGHST